MKKFVRGQTVARLKTVQAELRRSAATPEDPEAIHDLRVAIRRFLQCLRAFEQFFEEKPSRKIRKRLKKVMKRCGAIRNCDISMDLLREAGWGEAAAMDELRRRRADAGHALVERLARWPKHGTARWRRRLKPGNFGEGPWDGSTSAAANARRVLPGLAKELMEAGDQAASPDADHHAMHQFRLRAKRFRYTIEIFEPVYSGQSRKLQQGLRWMKQLQDHLGAINDCVTAREVLHDTPEAVAAVASLLPAREEEFRRYWKRRTGPRSAEWWTAWLSEPAPE